MPITIPNLAQEKYFDNHYKILNISSDGLEGFIAIHRHFNNYPSFGATRLWKYADQNLAIVDVLRLSHLMTYKSLTAELPYGGAKAVLLLNNAYKNNRSDFFQKYALEINKLNGYFITGCDVGISQKDVLEMKKISPYVVGTTIDPSYYTALGIVTTMEKVAVLSGMGNLENKKIGIDGVGKVGYEILKLLLKKKADIYISDIDENQSNKIKNEFSQIHILPSNSMYSYELDVYSPCALSDAINWGNYDSFKCKLIAGAANNQLADKKLSDNLWEKGIIYIPDYLINAGGLISVVSEYEGVVDTVSIKQKILSISERTEKFYLQAQQHNKPLHREVDDFVLQKLDKMI